MNQNYSSFERQGADDRRRAPGVMGGKTGMSLLIGGGVLLVAAAAGAYYLGTLRSTGPAPQAQAVNRPAQQQAQPAEAAQPPAPPPLQWTTVGTFGSWEARCATPAGQAKICTAVLQVIDNRSKNTLMAWIVGPDDKGAMQSVFQTPTGIMVANGVEVKLGNAPMRKIGYQSCGAQQCIASAPMNDAFIKEVVAAQKADVTLTALNGRALNFGIPVTGLDKALAAIKK
jgi:invasion protein IalB